MVVVAYIHGLTLYTCPYIEAFDHQEGRNYNTSNQADNRSKGAVPPAAEVDSDGVDKDGGESSTTVRHQVPGVLTVGKQRKLKSLW